MAGFRALRYFLAFAVRYGVRRLSCVKVISVRVNAKIYSTVRVVRTSISIRGRKSITAGVMTLLHIRKVRSVKEISVKWALSVTPSDPSSYTQRTRRNFPHNTS